MYRNFTILACALLTACQGYSPQPLDDAAHEAEWRGRNPQVALARDYLNHLAKGAVVGPRYDLKDGVSLAEAEIIALFFHPELRRARAEAGVALAGAEEAGRWEDPELEISGERILASVSNPWILGGMISFTLPLSGRHGVEEDKAWAEHRLALTHVVQAEWEALARLREHWIEAAAAAEELRLVRALVADLEKLKGVADKLAQAGELSRLDARLVDLELAARRIEAFGLETRAVESRLQLREDIGLHPDAPLEPALEFAAVAPPPLAAMRERNPALRAARARHEVSEQSLRLEIRKQYPDIVIGGGAGIEDGQSRIGIGLGLPIPIINLNKEGIARARAERVEARAAYEAAVETATHSLARAELRARRAAEQARQVRETLVPLADTQAAEAARLAELGEFDALRQLDVLTRQHEARVALLRADTEQREAAAALLQAVGPEWKEVEEEK